MEIYTGDLITIAQEYATKISEKINYTGYVVEDECCNLQHDIRKKIYERLSIAFNDLIEKEKLSCIERAYQQDDLKNKLFKIINEL
jgi:hypothetical protein